MFLLLSLIDIVVLFFLSRLITRALSQLIHRKTKRLHLTVTFFSFLLFPGTLLHELAHYITAHILGVRTFDFVLLPKLEENTVRLGSVSVAKSDSLRRMLIGIAPLVYGLGIIFFMLWWVYQQQHVVIWQVIVVGILVFQISNTMFPSKADLEGTMPFFILLLCVFLAGFYLFGYEAAYSLLGLHVFAKTALYYFSIIVAVDITAFIALKILMHRR